MINNKILIEEIKKRMIFLATKIKAPLEDLPSFERPIMDAYPYIECDRSGLMYYVVSERGTEIKREVAIDIDGLLYKVFADITSNMAWKLAKENSLPNKDKRRIAFAYQEELLEILNPKWMNKALEEHADILRRFPYDDLASLRTEYCRELRKEGLSESEIDKIAYKKYPENKE